MRMVSVIVMGILIGAGSVARAAEISGQVMMPRRGAAREAVVFLQGETKSAPLPKAIVDQREKTFIPHVSAVTVGTTVEFPNNDTVFHNVFTYFEAKKFDLGAYPRGATKRVQFDKTGIVALLCNVHSEMSAFIYVVDTPYYAVTDKSGHFQIKGVPPGNYTLRVWHESGNKLTQSLVVTAADAALTLTLARK